MVISESTIKQTLGSIGSRSFDDPDVQKAARDVLSTRSRKRDIQPTEVKTKVEPGETTVITELDSVTGRTSTRRRTTPEKRTLIETTPDGVETQTPVVRPILSPTREDKQTTFSDTSQPSLLELSGTPGPTRSDLSNPRTVLVGEEIKEFEDSKKFKFGPSESGLGLGSQFGRGVMASLLLDAEGIQRIKADGSAFEELGLALGLPIGEVVGEGLGSLAGKLSRFKGAAFRSISGASDSKAFAGTEGVVQVKTITGSKFVPVESKAIADVISVDQTKILRGDITTKVGTDLEFSEVAGIVSEQQKKSLLVTQTPKGFDSESAGLLTKTSEFGDDTKFVSNLLKGDELEEVSRSVGISKDIGKIGKFSLQESAGLTTKITDDLKLKPPTKPFDLSDFPDSNKVIIKQNAEIITLKDPSDVSVTKTSRTSPRIDEPRLDIEPVTKRSSKVTESSLKAQVEETATRAAKDLVSRQSAESVTSMIRGAQGIGTRLNLGTTQDLNLAVSSKQFDQPDLLSEVAQIHKSKNTLKDILGQEILPDQKMSPLTGQKLQDVFSKPRGVPGSFPVSAVAPFTLPLPPLALPKFRSSSSEPKKTKKKGIKGRRTRDLISSVFGTDIAVQNKETAKILEKTGLGFRF